MTLSELKRILGAETTKSLLLCSAEGRRLLAEWRMAEGTSNSKETAHAIKRFILDLKNRCSEYRKIID